MPFILPANTLSAGGYNVDNSLRVNRGSSDFLSKTFGTDGTHHDKGTLSVWLKRSEIGAESAVYTAGSSSRDFCRFESNDTLTFRNTSGHHLNTNRVFRDVSAFYNIVISFDSSQGTAANRVKFYVNGVQETSFATETYPSQNRDMKWFSAELQRLGADSEQDTPYANCYFCEVVGIDGLALAADSFGEFDEDSGIWKPIDVSGLTFGTNGFYLDFEDSGALGDDVSGNGNDFTVNNLTSIDQSTDTCTNNHATMNPLDSVNVTLSEGNLSASCASSSGVRSTIAVADGKFYAEVKFQNTTSMCGVTAMEQPVSTFNGTGALLFGQSGGSAPELFLNGTAPSTYSSAGAFSANDIMQIALDMDSNTVYFGKNGSWFGGTSWTESTPTTAHTLTSGYTYGFRGSTGSGTSVNIWNFGSPPYSISSGNADGNGYGNFEYAVPSGYYALNTKNLAEFG